MEFADVRANGIFLVCAGNILWFWLLFFDGLALGSS